MESTRSINGRWDVEIWPRVLEALKSGACLYRPIGLSRYFTECSDDRDKNHGIGLSANMVKKLEVDGVLTRCGVDRYCLGREPESVQPEVQRKDTQLLLFQD